MTVVEVVTVVVVGVEARGLVAAWGAGTVAPAVWARPTQVTPPSTSKRMTRWIMMPACQWVLSLLLWATPSPQCPFER